MEVISLRRNINMKNDVRRNKKRIFLTKKKMKAKYLNKQQDKII